MAAKKSPTKPVLKQQGAPVKPTKPVAKQPKKVEYDITDVRKRIRKAYEAGDSTEKARIRKLLTRFQ